MKFLTLLGTSSWQPPCASAERLRSKRRCYASYWRTCGWGDLADRGRLKALEGSAKRRPQHPGHYFVAAIGRCPWCAIESASGTLLFLAPLGAVVTDSHFNLAVVLSRITQIAPPGPVPEIPLPAAKPSPQASALRASRLARKIGGRIAVLIAAGIALAVAPGGFILWLVAALALWAGVGSWVKAEAEVGAFRSKRNEAHRLFTQSQERLRTETAPERFAQRLKALETMRAEYVNLPIVRDRKMKALIADREKHARTRFLEGFEIEDAKIPGIGPAKRAMLEIYNIETAADITESAVLDVPGFGPALYRRLADWRRSVEMRFRFDPNSAVDPRDIQDLERNLVQRRMQLERSLLQGAQDLARLRQEFARLREQLLKSAGPYAIAFAQADADWNALND
jgi:DNA-binding helix-hairpin-helix protein with protein kinase domain